MISRHYLQFPTNQETHKQQAISPMGSDNTSFDIPDTWQCAIRLVWMLYNYSILDADSYAQESHIWIAFQISLCGREIYQS